MNKEKQFVKILKDSKDKEYSFKKGEIYEVTDWYTKDEIVILENGDLVTIYFSDIYGKEAELCTNPYKIYELW